MKNTAQSRDAAEVSHVGNYRSPPRTTPPRSLDVEGENSPRTPNWKHVKRRMGEEFLMMKDRIKLIEKSLEASRQMQTAMLGKIDVIAEKRKDGPPPPPPPPRNEVENLRRELKRL